MTTIRTGRLPLPLAVADAVRPHAPAPAHVTGAPAAASLDRFTDAQRAATARAAPQAPTSPDASHQASSAAAVQGSDVSADALRVQRELSSTRQQLGAKLEQQAAIQQQSGDAVLAGAHAQQLEQLGSEIGTLRTTLDALVKAEAAQPRAEVERASFEVFLERFGELERSQGPEAATRLARQTWYNDRKFNVAGGSRPATEAQLLKAGLPTSATMRTPADERIDLGHVACALDWQLNPSVYHGLLVDLEQVTFTGDLAAAAQAVAESGLTPDAALEQQAGAPDLLGDYDGLNLAARLRERSGQDVSALLREYYADGPRDRLGELSQHSRFFQRDAGGTPLRDEAGRLRVDRDALDQAVSAFTLRLDVIGYGGRSVPESALQSAVDEVLSTWALQADLAL